MPIQTNVYQDPHSRAWVVAYRNDGDLEWSYAYTGGSEADARAMEARLRKVDPRDPRLHLAR